MSEALLATSCGLYCGSCRYYMAARCHGCDSPDRSGCELRRCCREQREHDFCTQCADFPCEKLMRSVGLHPRWLEAQAKIPLPPAE